VGRLYLAGAHHRKAGVRNAGAGFCKEAAVEAVTLSGRPD
jgi:hypothetical protein